MHEEQLICMRKIYCTLSNKITAHSFVICELGPPDTRKHEHISLDMTVKIVQD